MTSYGAVSEFSPNGGRSIVECIERLTFYFMANGSTEDSIEKEILLSNVGNECYHLIRNLAALNELSAAVMTFKTKINLLEEHLSPTPNPIVE